MGKRSFLVMLAGILLLLPGIPGFAQESAVKGSLGGLVLDSSGAVIPGADIKLTGPTGTRTTKSDEEGKFLFSLLPPATYNVRVEKSGFKASEAKGIEIVVGRLASLKMQLEPGAVSQTVEVSATALTVDVTSTASGADLNDTFYSKVPTPRNVSGLFYVAPGVADSGGAGQANPSISGGSGLENLYIADGVNITDAAFGGLGTFTRQYLSVGSGINLSFIKEVQVKTGGFEPQYGQATGGIVQIVTKSGSSDYHGAIAGYAAPVFGQATRNQVDSVRLNQQDELLNQGNYDASAELGGYIPGFREKLFFFGAYNPTLGANYSLPARVLQSGPGVTPVPVGLFTQLGGKQIYGRTFTNNYAGKLTWKLNEKHSLETSLFGDPSSNNFSNYRPPSLAPPLSSENNTAFSRWDYGTRNWVLRYNGTLSPTWTVNANFTWNKNTFNETPQFPNTFSVTDTTLGNLQFVRQGLGFVEDHKANDFAYSIDTSKIVHAFGQHTFTIGFNTDFLNYDDSKSRTGGRFPVPDTGDPARNMAIYQCATATNALGCPINFMSNAEFTLKTDSGCTACPIMTLPDGTTSPVYLSNNRGEFGPPLAQTEGKYYAGYISDAWTINKYVSVNLGLRWEQYHMQGVQQGYTFTDNWAPRLGVVVDPWGNRKSKVYANFGRYNYQMPLDAAIRSLSAELDIFNLNFAPASVGNVVTLNPNGSVNVIPNAAHLLNGLGATAGNANGATIFSNQAATEGFAPGTRMQYEDEWVVGFERDLGHGMVVSARYLDRRLRRVVEDVSGVSPEGAVAGEIQQFVITNPSKNTDLFANQPVPIVLAGAAATCPAGFRPNSLPATPTSPGGAADANGNIFLPGKTLCFGPSANGLDPGTPGADGLADGFINPVRNYQAVEIELNKAFSKGWLMRTNYRIARLQGNYEGAFRNDNGQTDPSISSLFDFVAGSFNLLGDQFAIGPLNTDRRHVVNGFFSYTFDRSAIKGLTLGTGIRVQGGTPISELADHPVYGNAGEVPIGGRGKLGRTPVSGAADLHADYVWKVTEKSRFKVGVDLFNVANTEPVTRIDQFRDLSFQGTNSNPDFQTPLAYQNPFISRFSLRWEF